MRPGVGGIIYNDGTILAPHRQHHRGGVQTGEANGNDGIDGQNNTGIQITNDTTGTIEGARHGITVGDASRHLDRR